MRKGAGGENACHLFTIFFLIDAHLFTPGFFFGNGSYFLGDKGVLDCKQHTQGNHLPSITKICALSHISRQKAVGT